MSLAIENSSLDCGSHNNNTAYNTSCTHGDFTGDVIDDETLMFYHILWSIVTPILFSVIILLGILGNLLVIYVILSRAKLRTATNYLLINLAVSDVALLCVCAPITAYKYAAVTWPFGDVTCKVVNYVIYVTVYVTVYTLVAVSFLRYITIIHNLTTAKFHTKRTILWTNFSIWITILIVNIPHLIVHKLKRFDEHFAYCGLTLGSTTAFYVTFFVFGYLLPLLIICVLYILVITHLYIASTSSIGQTRQRTIRASKAIILVVIVFALSWLPLHVNHLISEFLGVPQGRWFEVYRVLSNCLAYGNSCSNPIIYNYMSKDFREAFHDVVKCYRKRRSQSTSTTIDLDLNTEKTTML